MNDRRGLAAACGGLVALGVGLMAYRWFVLGFGWEGGRSTAILVASIACIVGGSQGARALGADLRRVPWWMRLAAGLPGLAAGAAIGFLIAPTIGHVALVDHEAGALTIGLPAGEETSQDGILGKILVKSAGGFETIVGVTWQPGTIDDQVMNAMASALSAGLGGSANVVDHDDFVVGEHVPHRSATMTKNGDHGWMTMFGCGAQLYGVYTFGHGADTLQRRVLATVRCHAKPGDAIAAVPAHVDLPAGWLSQPTEPGQLAWASADAALLVRPVESADDADLEKVFGVIGQAMGGSITLGARRSEPGPDGARTVWSGSMTVEKDTMAALISMWPCPGGPALLAMYLHAPGTDERAGVDVLMRVRCGAR